MREPNPFAYIFLFLIFATAVIFIDLGDNKKELKRIEDDICVSIIKKSKKSKEEKKHVHLKEGGVNAFSLPLKCKVCKDYLFRTKCFIHGFSNNHERASKDSNMRIGEPKKKTTQKTPWKFLGTFNVSAYCPKKCCCGKFADGKTATMKDAYTRGVAVDTRIIPFGTKLYIPDYGYATADDVGGSIKKNKLDVRFKTHREARCFGRKHLKVYYKEEK